MLATDARTDGRMAGIPRVCREDHGRRACIPTRIPGYIHREAYIPPGYPGT